MACDSFQCCSTPFFFRHLQRLIQSCEGEKNIMFCDYSKSLSIYRALWATNGVLPEKALVWAEFHSQRKLKAKDFEEKKIKSDAHSLMKVAKS